MATYDPYPTPALPVPPLNQPKYFFRDYFPAFIVKDAFAADFYAVLVPTEIVLKKQYRFLNLQSGEFVERPVSPTIPSLDDVAIPTPNYSSVTAGFRYRPYFDGDSWYFRAIAMFETKRPLELLSTLDSTTKGFDIDLFQQLSEWFDFSTDLEGPRPRSLRLSGPPPTLMPPVPAEKIQLELDECPFDWFLKGTSLCIKYRKLGVKKDNIRYINLMTRTRAILVDEDSRASESGGNSAQWNGIRVVDTMFKTSPAPDGGLTDLFSFSYNFVYITESVTGGAKRALPFYHKYPRQFVFDKAFHAWTSNYLKYSAPPTERIWGTVQSVAGVASAPPLWRLRNPPMPQRYLPTGASLESNGFILARWALAHGSSKPLTLNNVFPILLFTPAVPKFTVEDNEVTSNAYTETHSRYYRPLSSPDYSSPEFTRLDYTSPLGTPTIYKHHPHLVVFNCRKRKFALYERFLRKHEVVPGFFDSIYGENNLCYDSGSLNYIPVLYKKLNDVFVYGGEKLNFLKYSMWNRVPQFQSDLNDFSDLPSSYQTLPYHPAQIDYDFIEQTSGIYDYEVHEKHQLITQETDGEDFLYDTCKCSDCTINSTVNLLPGIGENPSLSLPPIDKFGITWVFNESVDVFNMLGFNNPWINYTNPTLSTANKNSIVTDNPDQLKPTVYSVPYQNLT